MVDDGRRDMKGDGDGWYLRCCTRRRRPTRCQFLLCLFTRESPFGGVCIHMQYIIHGLYFMKRNNENDRFLFPWCAASRSARSARSTTQHHAAHNYSMPSPHHLSSLSKCSLNFIQWCTQLKSLYATLYYIRVIGFV